MADQNTQSTKAALRAQLNALLKDMPAEERASCSRQACSRLEQQTVWQQANSILFYAPLPAELDLWPLLLQALATGKQICLPRFEPEQGAYAACLIEDVARDLQPGKFGIREPREGCPKIPLNRLDLILVPGIAFDLNGRRLGRGMGFYDRLLASLDGPTCGVAFDQQIVNHVPAEPHDIRLSCILTPTRWHSLGGPRAVLK
jgi:5-formyltetrahydrofolate cyclo-ligase